MLKHFALAAVFAVSSLAAAQSPASYSPPRTAEGRPDFQGVWGTSFLTPLERPPGVKDLVIGPAEAKVFAANFRASVPPIIDPDFQVQNIHAVSMVRGELRTSQIVEPADGRIPFTAKSLELIARSFEQDETAFDNPEERPKFDRCLTGMGQPPIRQLPAFVPTLIVQTRDHLVLAHEDVGSPRIVHLNGAAPPAGLLPSFEGWSSGRWDGDTLVIESTLTRPDDIYRGMLGRPILVEPDSKAIERMTRIGETELLYQFTVEDADLYSAPWLAEYVFELSDKPWYEYACHEANYSMTNMLVAARLGRQPKKKD